MAVALTRAVARSGAGESDETASLFAAALAIPITTLGAFAVVTALAPEQMAALIFGGTGNRELLFDASLATVPIVIHGVLYGYLRGKLKVAWSNALQLLNMGLVPLFVLAVLRPTSPHAAFRLMAGMWSIVVLATAAAHWSMIRRGLLTSHFRGAIRALFSYGAPRVPGEFALAFLFSWPTLYAGRHGSTAAAGYVSLSATLITLVGAAFAPIGQLVLPYASRLAATHEHSQLRRLAILLGATSVLASAVLAVTAAYGARSIFLALGMVSVLGAVPIIQAAAPAAVPYVAYVVLRNVLDAVSTVPHNAIALAVSAILLAGLAPTSSDNGPTQPFVLALTLLGSLSVIQTALVLRPRARG